MQGLCMEYGVQYIVDVSTTNHPADTDTETPYRVGDNAPGSIMIMWCLAWYCEVERVHSLGYPLYQGISLRLATVLRYLCHSNPLLLLLLRADSLLV